MRLSRLTSAQAITVHCPKCAAGPGEPCRYVPSPCLTLPGSTSEHILELRAQIGTPTLRSHNERFRHPLRRLQIWLEANATIFWENT